MTVVNSNFSAKSTSSPAISLHSNSLTILATKYSRCSMAVLSPAQILRPTPNGIMRIPLLPVTSTPSPSPPGRNLSGMNSIGFSHSFSSLPISATMKFTVAPLGMRYPPTSMSSAALCGSAKWPGGCFRRPSRMTAFRYGIFWVSSSVISSWSSLVLDLISSWSLDWMDGFLTSSAMIHCSVVDIVSVPASRNSEQSLTISSSVRARSPPSSGSLMSSSVSTYECSNVVVSFSGTARSASWFLRSRRALMSGMKSSFCRRRRARLVWMRPRKMCLVTAGQNAKTFIFVA
ncbi:Os10g0514550 [Oryza sativa Japonica Group]|uniref:Os10g0514550 protein n=1 Tax=Oryza sativa subsp. japonica TaxID=39947 RepID=A0A0P0XW62_ORYSJ|nr:Os10g0514550 [Oryza sativa Japonica Group]